MNAIVNSNPIYCNDMYVWSDVFK